VGTFERGHMFNNSMASVTSLASSRALRLTLGARSWHILYGLEVDGYAERVVDRVCVGECLTPGC
jgi:hypothetical protein